MSSRHDHASATPHRQYRFGDFTLDLDGGFLRRRDAEVTLRPKAFDALAYLVERHGRLVTKTELIEAIWPEAAVTDNSLAHCLMEIRRALGDDSQQVIRTVSRRGYVFAASVTTPDRAFDSGPGEADPEGRAALPSVSSRTVPKPRRLKVVGAVLVLAVAAGGILAVRSTRPTRHDVIYTQLTDFTDSATSPAVSPDGRMLTFIRGSSTFLDRGQVYVKLLPDGEPVPLTRDDRPKMAPVFSPDGSRIVYTVYTSGEWTTWTVPVLGGETRPMLANVAALTWIGNDRILFSEIKRDFHMAIVTGTESRAELRDVYVPQAENGMAHRSYPSPDRRWVLIASEMLAGGWLPCRMVPIDGSQAGRIVGPPQAKCTCAAWSPDGQWMYFSADAGGGFHTWRQRFPDGAPEQITFGATDEEGIAMWPDGRSFVSSVGTMASSIWVHDTGNERQITSEGYGHLPSFSADGKKVYYLLRVSGVQQWTAGRLWAFDLATGGRQQILADMSLAQYEVSSDGARVVFVRTDPGREGVWVAHLDGRRPLVQLSSGSNVRAFFGPAGTVVFEAEDGQARYLFRVREDGSSRQKVAAEPIGYLMNVSPDRRWAVVRTPGSGDLQSLPMVAYPIDGGEAVRLCENCGSAGAGGPLRGNTPPVLSWSPDGQYLYFRLELVSEYETGKTYVLRLASPSALPPAFQDETDVATMSGMRVIPHGGIFPGPHPALYAYTRMVTHRNLYRISLP